MKIKITLLLIVLTLSINAQNTMNDQLPYAEIPEAPIEYTAMTVTSRMIDGLGFRFYWATEGLTEENLEFKVSEDSRTMAENIEHIYNLSMVILNSTKKLPNDSRVKKLRPTRSEMRAAILNNLKEASELIKTATNLEEHNIIFIGINGQREYPFWNQINGPIEDAVWHTGQLVMMRRAAGNPFNSKVSVLAGKLRE